MNYFEELERRTLAAQTMSSATPWSIDDLTKAMEALDAMGPPPAGEGWVSQETQEAIQRQVTFAEDQSRVLWGIHLKIDPTLKPGEFKYDGRILNIFKIVPQTLFCKRCNQEVPRYHDCGGAF